VITLRIILSRIDLGIPDKLGLQVLTLIRRNGHDKPAVFVYRSLSAGSSNIRIVGNYTVPDVVNQKFTDFDLFAHITKMWDLDFRQIDSGDFQADVLQIASPSWQIGEGKFNRKLDQRGSSPFGLRTFALLSGQSPDIIWHGYETDKNNIMVFPEDCELDSLSSPGFDVFALSYTEDLLLDVIDTLDVGKGSDILKEAEVIACDPGSMVTLQNIINNLLTDLRLNAPKMSAAQLVYEVEYEIPHAIILALASKDSKDKKPSPKQGYLTIKRVKEYLEAYTYDDITVSERTLRYAFNEYFGISPKAFVKMIRLNRVRRDLARTNAEDKNVSDVANRWGFWHLGQFAKDYKMLFGELPSETSRQI
jgi:AraC family transcriptional regulator, ethanolamine operon transcriptional activator